MTVRVGVIGAGAIGQDHIRRLTHVISGSRVVAVTDVDVARARAVADGVEGTRVHVSGQDLVRDEDVDAVLVASWAPTHEEYVLASIETGKAVFCEKPLATTPEACRRIVDAEVARRRRFVQVGFMRRYDAGYRAMKAALDEGKVGAALTVHCAHRNRAAPRHDFNSDMMISDSASHEFDLVRWLLEQDITAAMVLKPRRTSRANPGLQDPMIVVLETAEGVIVDVEIFLNCGYGYDIRCELVAESGTLSLGEGSDVVLRQSGLRSDRVPADWQERFARAYDTELQEWIDVVAGGGSTGPSAWDGYAASVVVAAAIDALNSGQRSDVQLAAAPELYSGRVPEPRSR